MTCRGCAGDIPDDSRFCPVCGAAQATPIAEARFRAVLKSAKWPPLHLPEGWPDGNMVAARIESSLGRLSSRVTPDNVCFASGVALGVLGFLLGLSGHGTALDWMLLGLLLVASAIYLRARV